MKMNEKGFFAIDIFMLLPCLGMLVVYLAVRHLYKIFSARISIRILSMLTVLSFWLIAGWALYFDGIFSNGNWFMWLGLNWLLDSFGALRPTYADFGGFWNMLAMFLFIFVYPLALWTGIQTGYWVFGRSEKQIGFIDFLFPNKKVK